MGHPELEVFKTGVQVQKDERHLLLRQKDVERVLVVLLFTPEDWNDDSAVGPELIDQVLVGQDSLTAKPDTSPNLRRHGLQPVVLRCGRRDLHSKGTQLGEKRDQRLQKRAHGNRFENVSIRRLGAALLPEGYDRLILRRTLDKVGEVELQDGGQLEELVRPREIGALHPVGHGLCRHLKLGRQILLCPPASLQCLLELFAVDNFVHSR
mmetsp:Transcript_59148/g.139280  ORF Transcript_59148/g.139280 Transcript_59148/m.139280 type:complete len:209 (+) Transcript_59148:4062-4688(+)